MKKKLLSFSIFLAFFNNNCFNIVNSTNQLIKNNFVSFFKSKPKVIQTYQTTANQTKTITLPYHSNKLRIILLNSTNQKLLALTVINGLLQDIKTSSTARLLIKKANNQIKARIIR